MNECYKYITDVFIVKQPCVLGHKQNAVLHSASKYGVIVCLQDSQFNVDNAITVSYLRISSLFSFYASGLLIFRFTFFLLPKLCKKISKRVKSVICSVSVVEESKTATINRHYDYFLNKTYLFNSFIVLSVYIVQACLKYNLFRESNLRNKEKLTEL